MRRTKRTGFTRIEPMVVVAIVGILAAVAVPKGRAPGRNGTIWTGS